ncbi:MAG TPA: hypothetical protein VN922_20595 [Bacteroidia bacterium]|nr:hypothetical protein [Bacteroidia bacterium]
MKTKAHIILVAIVAFLSGCSYSLFAQDQNQPSGSKDPDVHISVHKQTDANGNVISYDSTYTYNYSGKCCHNNAYVDSIMRRYGMGMNSMFFSIPLNTPDISNYPFIQQYGVMDFDKMQQMLQKQMNEMMQMYGMPPCNGFFCQPAPTPQCCPKDSVQYRREHLEKKNCPKQNKAKGGVQI